MLCCKVFNVTSIFLIQKIFEIIFYCGKIHVTIYRFNFLSVQFCSIRSIHNVYNYHTIHLQNFVFPNWNSILSK